MLRSSRAQPQGFKNNTSNATSIATSVNLFYAVIKRFTPTQVSANDQRISQDQDLSDEETSNCRPRRRTAPNIRWQDMTAGPTHVQGVKAPFLLYYNSGIKPFIMEETIEIDSITDQLLKVYNIFYKSIRT